jgi:hypothetical protein
MTRPTARPPPGGVADLDGLAVVAIVVRDRAVPAAAGGHGLLVTQQSRFPYGPPMRSGDAADRAGKGSVAAVSAVLPWS